MQAYVLTIGDELLYGQRKDTNSTYLAEQLSILGFKVVGLGSVGDKKAHIRESVIYAFTQAACVLVTGGLGPTEDDVTRAALSEVLQCALQPHPEAKAELQAYAKRRGQRDPYPESMWCLPRGSSLLRNPVGLAVGIWYKRKGRVLVALPGVPQEMKAMYEQSLRPKLKTLVGKAVIQHLYCQTVGVPESKLSERLRAFEKTLPKTCKLAYLPRPGQVSLRLSEEKKHSTKVEYLLKALHKRLQEILTDCLYATEDKLLEEVLAEQLKAKKLSLSVAESCTGGQLSKTFTLQTSASSYFKGGVIAYQNHLKEKLLGVPQKLIEKEGAVSKSVVEAMAKGVQQRLGADIGLAISGIAGPSGGTPEKPVGTTWVAIYYKNKVSSNCHYFASNRAGNIHYAVAYALALLWHSLRH